ncbi:MAG: GAF domain-containing protein [Bacteroidota bacterium]
MALDRQDKALREFKQIIEDLVKLLRASTGVELAYMCWVNHAREQFVWECNSTNLPNVMFRDRVEFRLHYLDAYKAIEQPVQLKVGTDVQKGKLSHYFDFVQAQSILIIPFISKGETVALTILESEHEISESAITESIHAYNNALVNVLDTYLEIVDLHEQQKEWDAYEDSLNHIDYRSHRVELLARMVDEMQRLVPNGGVSLLCSGMDTWNVALTARDAIAPPRLGLQMEEKSLAYDALEKGHPIFSMHFNNSPRRISSQEIHTNGASYAMPVLIHDRRQAVVVAYDNDPLTFKESTQHKLSNLARVAGLSIQSVMKKSGMINDMLTEQFGAFVSEMWEQNIARALYRAQQGDETRTWFGFVSPDDISGLRTKFRLEELQHIQTDFVRFLNPNHHGETGFIGYNSDYVYTFFIQSPREDAVMRWIDSIKTKLAHGFKLSSGSTINASFSAGFTEITADGSTPYMIQDKAKRALSEAVKNEALDFFEA